MQKPQRRGISVSAPPRGLLLTSEFTMFLVAAKLFSEFLMVPYCFSVSTPFFHPPFATARAIALGSAGTGEDCSSGTRLPGNSFLVSGEISGSPVIRWTRRMADLGETRAEGFFLSLTREHWDQSRDIGVPIRKPSNDWLVNSMFESAVNNYWSINIMLGSVINNYCEASKWNSINDSFLLGLARVASLLVIS